MKIDKKKGVLIIQKSDLKNHNYTKHIPVLNLHEVYDNS